MSVKEQNSTESVDPLPDSSKRRPNIFQYFVVWQKPFGTLKGRRAADFQVVKEEKEHLFLLQMRWSKASEQRGSGSYCWCGLEGKCVWGHQRPGVWTKKLLPTGRMKVKLMSGSKAHSQSTVAERGQHWSVCRQNHTNTYNSHSWHLPQRDNIWLS